MAFGRDLGKGAGKLVGGLVKLGTDKVADVTDSRFIREVGEAAERATIRTGELAGRAADGIGGTVRGVVSGDSQMAKDGLKETGSAAMDTLTGVALGIGTVANDGATVFKCIKSGHTATAGAAARNIAKVAVVSVLAVGVLDVLDVVDIGSEGIAEGEVENGDSVAATNEVDPSVGEPNIHFVEPHEVSSYVRADGTQVAGYWRDGDGDSDVDLSAEDGGGYHRSDPDGITGNNLRPS